MPSTLELSIKNIDAMQKGRLYIPTEEETRELIPRRFHVIQPLGRGGQGTVYHAWEYFDESQRTVKRHVAIKALNPQPVFTSEEEIRRLYDNFQKEAIVQGHFFDTRLVQVYEWLEVDHKKGLASFMVMQALSPKEYLNLDSDTVRKLPLNKKIGIVANTTSLLANLFRATKQKPEDIPLLHNDLSTDAVLYNPTEDKIKVIDFGINTYTNQDHALGKIHFAPPESFNQVNPTDVRSEIWKLGCITYFLLTGHHYLEDASTALHYRINMPHSGHGLRKIEQRRISEAISKNPELEQNRPQIEDLFLKTFSLHPPDRQQSFEEYNNEMQTAFMT